MRIKTALLASGWLVLALPPALAAPSVPTSLAVQQDQPKSTYALISATIIDEFGEPMMGVSVQVSGMTGGFITDAKGHFEFKTTKPSETVRLSFVGYKAKSLTLQAGKPQRIALEPDSEMLKDVVVTGFT